MPLYERLDDCQKTAVRRGIRLKCACIFFEQGVGKTHPTVSLIEELANEEFSGFVVSMLSNIDTTWRTLIKEELPWLNISSDWVEFKKLPKPRLFLIHYQGLKPLKGKFDKFKWTFGAFDESQGLKARGTIQSRIAGLIRDCEYRFALSGTPMDGDEIHLFGQLRFVAPHLYGNDRSAWKRFDAAYLKPTGYMGYARKFRPERLPIFIKEIAPYVIRVEAKDVLKLPPVTDILVGLEFRGEQKRIYETMERDSVVYVTEMESKAKALKAEALEYAEAGNNRQAKKLRSEARRITAGLRITQMIKLQQVCGGFIIDDEGETTRIPSVKLSKLERILELKAKKPVVIFCKYTQERKDIEELLTSMGWKHASIHGKIRDKKIKKERSDTIRLFQSGGLDAIVCQVKAGGVGVDLFAARTGIFFSTTFSWIDYDQCRKRISRRGQKFPTDLFFIFVKKSIDEDIYSTILFKKSVTKRTFNQMKKRIKYGQGR